MTKTGEKEIYYLRLLPADEIADYIYALPYTLVESIIETALNDEDFLFDLLTEIIGILKDNMDLRTSKKALRKLLKVCQVLGCVGYFDFGDWEAIRGEENEATSLESSENIKNLFDMSITKFPENADKKDREMLNILGKELLIDRILSSENKYRISRPTNCKEVVRELLKHGYNKNSGFIFMKSYIYGYRADDSSLQNYFRTCIKDIPFRK
jgi:hypothetical protein